MQHYQPPVTSYPSPNPSANTISNACSQAPLALFNFLNVTAQLSPLYKRQVIYIGFIFNIFTFTLQAGRQKIIKETVYSLSGIE